MNSEENDKARIVEALALYHFKSEMGISLFKYAMDKDDSERFSKVSASFYLAHLQRLLGHF